MDWWKESRADRSQQVRDEPHSGLIETVGIGDCGAKGRHLESEQEAQLPGNNIQEQQRAHRQNFE